MRRSVLVLLAAVLLPSAMPAVPSARGRWSRTANDPTGHRFDATATLLMDGRVAVSGGSTAVIDLFDPVTNTFTPGPSDLLARDGSTATRLQDGRVLFAGGSYDTPSSCSIFNPATGGVAATGSMITGRNSHTATLLPDGRVFVTGGVTPTHSTRTCEIFDPSTGTWSSAGSLQKQRVGHTATLLPSGKILIAGGDSWGSTTFTAELYDPATMTSAMVAGTLGAQRIGHSATAGPDGRIFIIGGWVDPVADETVVDVYDPAANTLTAGAARFALAGMLHAAALLQDGRIVIAGSTPDPSESYGRGMSAVFDPSMGKGIITARMIRPRHSPAGVVLQDGRFLVVGGEFGTDTTTAEVFDPAAPGVPRGDLTGDAMADILWRDPATNRHVIWRMNGLAAELSSTTFGGCYPRLELVLDLDGGGGAEGFYRSFVQLWYAHGFPARLCQGWGQQLSMWTAVAAADFNGDGRDDFAWRRTNGEVAISLTTRLSMTSTYAMSTQSLLVVSDPDWIIAAAGDFDGDGYADIFWRHLSRGENYIWFMEGATVARAGQTEPVADMSYSVAGTGDFDGDGRTEIVWRNTSGATRMWFMNGVTVANGVAVPAPGAGWNVGVIGDFDGDGKSDVFWRNPTSGENAVTLFDGFTAKASSSLPPVAEAGWMPVDPGRQLQ